MFARQEVFLLKAAEVCCSHTHGQIFSQQPGFLSRSDRRFQPSFPPLCGSFCYLLSQPRWNDTHSAAATLCGIIQRSPKLFNCKPLKPDHIQIQLVQ